MGSKKNQSVAISKKNHQSEKTVNCSLHEKKTSNTPSIMQIKNIEEYEKKTRLSSKVEFLKNDF